MIEYFSQNLWLLWLLVAIVCLILELSSGTFFIMCFAIGAVAACISALVSPSVTVQILVFALFSVLSIYVVRPFAMKYLHRRKGDKVSNADAIIDRIGTVVEAIDENGYGRVQIDGDDWKSLSSDGHRIEKGMKVRVIARDSIIITVEKV
jgi:membrane protein implicated in regulation of membrane protease activity